MLRQLHRRVVNQQLLCLTLCELQQRKIGAHIRDSQLRQTVLPRAEEITRAAQAKILVRNPKAVGRFAHYTQTFLRLLILRVRHQNAGGFFRAAPNSPAQLVQLRKAVPLCVFNQHHNGVRHIHANLHDRGGN